MQKKKMNACVMTGYGSADVLQMQEIDRPQAKSNEILVRVVATTATQADTMMRTGKPYFARLFLGLRKPKHPIPGTGFAGFVESVGEGVQKFIVGERVFGLTTLGFSANAEYLTIAEDGVVLHKPENLHFSDAACFGDGLTTAYNFLKEIANIQAGQKILIIGASGSVGSAAVQIAKHFGAIVTGVASGRNAGLVRSLGADHFIDYTQENYTESSETYDFVFDAVGKSTFKKCKSILKTHGMYMSTVLKLPILFQMLYTKYFSKKKAKFEASGLNSNTTLTNWMQEVLMIKKSGKLKILIDRQYPLSRLAEAHRYIDTGRKKGNIVILPE